MPLLPSLPPRLIEDGWIPEAHVQQAIGLVQDKHAQIRQHRPQLLHVLQVVQQPPRCGHLHTHG